MHLLLIDDEYDWIEELSDYLSPRPEFQHISGLQHPGDLDTFLQNQQPDLICLDLQMLPLDGLQMAQMLCWRPLQAPILLLSAHLEDYPLDALLATGISGMLSKDQLQHLPTALLALAQGQTWFPQLALGQQSQQESSRNEALEHCWAQLSPRQKDVCLLLSQGLAPKTIASSLQIGAETVKSHLSQARQIFGVDQSYALLARLHQLSMARQQKQLQSHKERLYQQNAYRPQRHKP